MIIDLIHNLIEPYEKYTMNIINNYKEDLKFNERIIDIYIIILNSVLKNYKNVFINYNKEDNYQILKEQLTKINSYFNKQFQNVKQIIDLLIKNNNENKKSFFANSKSEQEFYNNISSH